MLKTASFIVAFIILLPGCMPRKLPHPTHSVNFVDIKLRDAAESISKDMALISGSTQNRDDAIEKGNGDIYKKMDLSWDGPIEGALRKVASTIGFTFNVDGKGPKTPVIIHVKLADRPCLAILREIGLQTGPREGVIVDEAAHAIILKYAGDGE